MQIHISDNVTVTQLIQDSINGCPKMKYSLNRKFAAKMYPVCMRFTNYNPEDAKAILQDGFMKVFKILHKFRHDGSFEGYNHREIAVLLNCSEGTSKSQLYRSKTGLKEILRKTA